MTAYAAFGKVDILVNSAGIGYRTRVDEYDAARRL